MMRKSRTKFEVGEKVEYAAEAKRGGREVNALDGETEAMEAGEARPGQCNRVRRKGQKEGVYRRRASFSASSKI
jgi:hypothetical protein